MTSVLIHVFERLIGLAFDWMLKKRDPSPNIMASRAFLRVLGGSRFAKTARRKGLLSQAERYESHLSEDERYEQRLARRLDLRLHDLLRQGHLASWGRPGPHEPERPIDAKEWSEIALWFDRKSLEEDWPASCAYFRGGSRNPLTAYVQVRFCKAQVDRQFPRAWLPRRRRRLVGTRALADLKI